MTTETLQKKLCEDLYLVIQDVTETNSQPITLGYFTPPNPEELIGPHLCTDSLLELPEGIEDNRIQRKVPQAEARAPKQKLHLESSDFPGNSSDEPLLACFA